MTPAAPDAPTTSSEVERKYDIGEQASTPELVGVGPIASMSDPEALQLIAVYFDTAGLDLATNSIALRRRQGGADAGWHIKRPATEGRTEVHWPLGSGSSVPSAVAEYLREYVGDRALEPVARVSNARTTRLLLDATGTAVAELCDDRVHSEDLIAGVSRVWREWEVELLEGAPDTVLGRAALLDTIETAVGAAGGRPSASVSKLARALGRD
ncbi:MAG: CYTH domain-containing protein [Microbacteriaceae bacterium]